MKPEQHSKSLLGVTRSFAKMFEYRVPEEHHIKSSRNPSLLFSLAIGLLGDYCSSINIEGRVGNGTKALHEDLRFSAQFFDAYRDSKVDSTLDPYVSLIGAATYYFCDLPGSAGVLAKTLPDVCPDLGGHGLEDIVLWLIRGDFEEPDPTFSPSFGGRISDIAAWITAYFAGDVNADEAILFQLLRRLRRRVYNSGSPRQLLLGDIACALARLRYLNSARYTLPRYSDLAAEVWAPYFSKSTAIRELWPAQQLIGRANVLAGKSAIIQLPTSAGKTRGTELVIRSSFLSNRSDLAVIVAPFRALCHEIRKSCVKAFAGEAVNVDELTEVTQNDFDILALLSGKQIVVVTPEKLLYVLRHNPEVADSIGLMIYDEGHQFDSGNRGVTYELLITSLKALIPKNAQTVLISAVISNAERINGWLNDSSGVVIAGNNVLPTYRSVAFTSWQSPLGQLEFVDPNNPNQQEFSVPRVLENLPLGRLKGERKDRTFPNKEDGFEIAVYLGVKLVKQGSVALFCGRKDTASNIALTAADIFARGIRLAQPLKSANKAEVEKLAKLYSAHLGKDADATTASKIGVFTHHGNTPHGLRLAVEHAMKEGLASFVVCTSTLAQGINLPIRYLIVTGTYQGQDQIKTRDFHNLMGRVGRAGMHTEGSVLFSDPNLFDKRNGNGKFRWSRVTNLLDPTKSEPCASSLLSIFSPYVSEDGQFEINMEPLTFSTAYIKNVEDLMQRSRELAKRHSGSGFTEAGIMGQVEMKARAIAAVESHLMAFWDDVSDMPDESIASLARGTLAHYLAGKDEKDLLVKLFLMLAENIRATVKTAQMRQIFSKILFGVYESKLIQTWVEENERAIARSASTSELLEVLWPLIARCIRNSTFKKLNPDSVRLPLAKQWINGESFESMFATITYNNVRLGHGKKPRKAKVEHAVDIAENGFAYDGMLIVGAVRELYALKHPDDSTPIELLEFLQRQMKYGLGSLSSVLLFEIGFADRFVAQKLDGVVEAAPSRRRLAQRIRENSSPVRKALIEFPTYFTSVLDSLIS